MSFSTIGFGKILGDIFTRIQGQSLIPARQRRRKGGPGRTAPMAALEQRVLLAGFENFDSVSAPALPAGWTQATTGLVSSFWETFPAGGVGNTGHVFIAGQNSVSDTSLTSPSVAINQFNSQLKFQHTWDMDHLAATSQEFDGGMLEISINGGAFQDIIVAGGTFVEGGYNGTVDNGGDTPTPLRPCWGATSGGGFITTRVNLPTAAIGQNVQLRWRFSSDNVEASAGWGIDSIELNDPNPADHLNETFDSVSAPALPAGWTQSTIGFLADIWETSSTGGVGNSGHVFITGEPERTDTSLTSPSLAINQSNSQLKFQHTWDLDHLAATSQEFDGGMLEISINSGAFQDIIVAGGTFVEGGYNGTIDNGGSTPTPNRPCWGATSGGGFITTRVNLPAAAIGQVVQFRWRFSTDNVEASAGWGIDSIELRDTDTDDQISEAPVRTLDSTVTNTIAHSRDVDMYAFDVVAGQTVVFDLDFATVGATAPMTDSYLRLFNAAGVQLATNDDANAPGETASPARESFIRHTFTTAGRFFVGVSAFDNETYNATTGEGDINGSNSGGYSLRIERTPTVTVTMSDTALKIGETSLVTFTFSEAVTGFANADVTVENGTLSTITQVGSSNVYTATFTPAANITDTTNLITVTGSGFTDATLNPGSNTSSPNYTIDTARPTATITMADTALRIGETSLVTFTFSEALAAGTFTNADMIVVQNGTLSAVTQVGSSNVWTATFTPNANITDTTNVIGLNLAGVTDLVGNAGVGGVDSPNYTIDTVRPTIVSMVRTTPSTVLTNATTVTFTATFSEAVTGVDLADFGTFGPVGVGGGFVSGSGAVYTVTLQGLTGSGQKGLGLQPGATFADLAGNSAVVPGVISGEAYTIDLTAPTVAITMADTALRIGETSLVTFTFSEAVTGFVSTDVNLSNANGTLSALTTANGGVTWTGTFTPTANITDTTNAINLAGSQYTDLAGNAGSGTASSPNYTLDTQRPTAVITMSDTALKAGETSVVTITFSEAVSAATFTNADFIVIQNGTLSAVTQVGSTPVYTATFTPNANITDTTNVIGLNLAGVTDLAGNAGVGGVDSPNYTIDTARPTIVSMVRTTPSTALTNATTVTFTATFSEPVTGVDLADFGTFGPVGVGGGFVSGSGAVYTVTLTGLTGSGQKGLGLQPNATFADLAGNSAVVPNVISGEAYEIDQTRPTVAITMSDTNLNAGETSLVTFTFSEAVTGFTNADISVQNGTLSAVATSNGGVTWTGTFTPNANILDATNVITVTNSGVTDLAGNAGTGTTNSPNYAIETFSTGFVGLMNDPDAPGQQMLVISGTTANDTISVAKGPKSAPGSYIVTFNGVKSPALVPTSRILGLGRLGNDKITLASSLPIAAHLFGDAGNDSLTGSSGPDLIFGGENNDTINGSTGDNRLFGENGDDIISASSGHDVIYGGAGLDKISGSTGNNLMFGEAGNDTISGAGVLVGGLDNDTLTPASSRSIAIGGLGTDVLKSASKKGDILIGGTTDFDTNENALRSLHAEWSSANPIQTRIDHLAGLLPGGSNGSTFLISDAVRPGTVHNDSVNDTLTNAFADDWLLPFAGDIRTKIIGRVNHL